MNVLFDTSVLVAARVAVHPAHRRALPWLRRAKCGEVGFLVAAHTLAERCAVLTRLPTARRIAPVDAHRLVQDNVVSHADVVALDAADYKTLLLRLTELGLAGGAVYDGLIAFAARKAGADLLLTLNVDHFRRVLPEGMPDIVSP